MSDIYDLPFFEQAMLVILGVAATAISGAIISHYRTKSKCFEEMKKQVDKLIQRSFRTDKALILSMSMIDSQTMQAHSETKSKLEAIVKEILADEEDKL